MAMADRSRQSSSRRELFRLIGRGGAGAALAALGALLAIRSRGRHGRGAGQACINDGLCTRCSTLDGCGLPRAQITRRQATRS